MAQHEQTLGQVEKDLAEHREFVPEKGSRPRVIQDYLDKETYLEFEVFFNSLYRFLDRCLLFDFCGLCVLFSPLCAHLVSWLLLNWFCYWSFFIFDMFH